MRAATVSAAVTAAVQHGAPWLAVAALAAAGAACVPSSRYHEPQPVARSAESPGVDSTAAALVGDWAGHYDAPLYARRGDLRLSLRRVAHASDGAVAGSVVGTATFAGASIPARVVVDSARVGRGRVVLFLAPLVDQESAATVQLRLDGVLAADTLGGRLRADLAATVAPERRGGWRVVRVLPDRAAR